MSLATVLTALPTDAIVAAMQDPTNLGKEAAVAEALISEFAPGLPGVILPILIELFVAWVYASGGGTIAPDPLPMTDAQTSLGRGGRRE